VVPHANDNRVLGWDVINEPGPWSDDAVVAFVHHFVSYVNGKMGPKQFTTVGVASSNQQYFVQDLVTLLSFHNYVTTENGTGVLLMHDIKSQQLLGTKLNKPVLLTETVGRPIQPLCEVLRVTKEAHIGWFVWELMLGVDQFSAPNGIGCPPFQGLVLPNGGLYDNVEEQSCLENADSVIWMKDGNFDFVTYDPQDAWKEFKPNQVQWGTCGPIDNTLHYTNTPKANMTFSIFSACQDGPGGALLYFKSGPDCGIFNVYVDDKLSVLERDTYHPTVIWNSRIQVPLACSTKPRKLSVIATGTKNPASSDAYIQIVGLSIMCPF